MTSEPFVEVIERPPGVREVRETNLCRIHATVDRGGRMMVFAAIDNLWKGAASQAVQNLNLMLGLDEGDGHLVSASGSRSRWVEPPDGVVELEPTALAPGFRAAGWPRA